MQFAHHVGHAQEQPSRGWLTAREMMDPFVTGDLACSPHGTNDDKKGSIRHLGLQLLWGRILPDSCPQVLLPHDSAADHAVVLSRRQSRGKEADEIVVFTTAETGKWARLGAAWPSACSVVGRMGEQDKRRAPRRSGAFRSASSAFLSILDSRIQEVGVR